MFLHTLALKIRKGGQITGLTYHVFTVGAWRHVKLVTMRRTWNAWLHTQAPSVQHKTTNLFTNATPVPLQWLTHDIKTRDGLYAVLASSRRLTILEFPVCAQVSTCGVSSRHSGIGTDFFQSPLVYTCSRMLAIHSCYNLGAGHWAVSGPVLYRHTVPLHNKVGCT